MKRPLKHLCGLSLGVIALVAPGLWAQPPAVDTSKDDIKKQGLGLVAVSYDSAETLKKERSTVASIFAKQGAGATGAVRSDTMHLTVLTSISDTDVAPGKRISVVFDVTPKKAMHVYAPGKHDYQVIAVKLDPQPWLKVPPLSYPPSEIYHFKELNEKVETYGKPFKLVQDLTILAAQDVQKLLAASPTATLNGRLEYQACDDRVCYAPTRVPFSFTLNVKPLDRK